VSSRGTQLLTRVFEPGGPKPSLVPGTWAPGTGQSSIAPAVSPARDAAAKLSPPSKRRTQIWELHQSLHCSIIGTCLSSAELRRLLVRLDVQGAEAADDHDLHVLGVLLASRSKTGAKHLQKTLDRRHQPSLNQFAKAKDAAAVSAVWEEALGRGDIPGAYWALLTHPAATDAIVKDVFGKVHMLSHLVGAANRADIRRLRQLEEDNASLTAKLERQQRQLRDGFISRDESIRRRPRMPRRSRTRSPNWTNVWRMRQAVANGSSNGSRAFPAPSMRPSGHVRMRNASLAPFIGSLLHWNPGWARRCRARTAPRRMGSICTA
jgi:hypothetical protein